MKALTILLFMSVVSCGHVLSQRKATIDNNEVQKSSYLEEGEHYIEIDHVKLWYFVRGNGPILLVYSSSPGWGGDVSVYIKSLQGLENERTIIYFEPRGGGKSERMDSISDLSSDKYVEELELFRKRIGIEKFDLLGHCVAGMIVQKYALKYQEHLRSIILISAFPSTLKKYGGDVDWGKSRPGYEAMQKRELEIEKQELTKEMRLRENWKNWFSIYFSDYELHKDHFEQILDSTIFSPMQFEEYFSVEVRVFNVLDSLQMITVPCLVLYGDQEPPAMTHGAVDITQHIKNSEMVEFANCCHWCFIEYPDKFFNVTIDFLNRH